MIDRELQVLTIGYRAPRQLRALIVGGTRGIGSAIVARLHAAEWTVIATGRQDFDIGLPDTWSAWSSPEDSFDLVVFSAGLLDPVPWNHKTIADYLRSYAVHVAGPLMFLSRHRELFLWWTKVVFLSTVGAVNAGAVDLAYGCAKAALEKAARALAEAEAWRVYCPRLDLVDTAMLDKLPSESLHGRPVMTKEEAAEFILREAEIV